MNKRADHGGRRIAPRGAIPRFLGFLSAPFLAAALLVLAAAGQARGQDLFFWSVESPDGARLHLFGSIHVASPDVYPLPDRIMEAFGRSDRLVVEADVTDVDEAAILMEMVKAGRLEGEAALWDLLDPELGAGLEACLDAMGLAKWGFNRLKPWMASTTLELLRLAKMGYDPKQGLDLYFLLQAREKALPIGQLESAGEQMRLFTELSDQESLQLLKHSVLECGAGEEELDRLLASWRDGDLEAFETIYFRAYHEHPDLAPLFDKIIHQRNASMHQRLQRFLQPGSTSFVVIGAAHMVGPDGLPERFRAQGLSVVRR